MFQLSVFVQERNVTDRYSAQIAPVQLLAGVSRLVFRQRQLSGKLLVARGALECLFRVHPKLVRIHGPLVRIGLLADIARRFVTFVQIADVVFHFLFTEKQLATDRAWNAILGLDLFVPSLVTL